MVIAYSYRQLKNTLKQRKTNLKRSPKGDKHFVGLLHLHTAGSEISLHWLTMVAVIFISRSPREGGSHSRYIELLPATRAPAFKKLWSVDLKTDRVSSGGLGPLLRSR